MTVSGTASRTTHPGSRQRVLLVDDDLTNLQVLHRTLRSEQYELIVAQSGDEAITQAQALEPALILLDVRMPGVDGFETCRRLKSDARTRESLVIFMSAFNDMKDRVRGLELGAVDYITKPFYAAEVVARVRIHLELRRLNHALAVTNEGLVAANLKLKRDLEVAATFQRALLPASAAELPGYGFAWRYRPFEEPSDEAPNPFPPHGGYIGAYVLDVSGHGAAPTLLTVPVAHSPIPRPGVPSVIMDVMAGAINSPSEAAERLDRTHPMTSRDGYFTLAYGALNTATGVLRHVAAGDPGEVLIRNQEARRIDRENLPMGKFSHARYSENKIELLPGDRIYLHSERIAEESDPKGEPFGEERLHAELLAAGNLPLARSIDHLVNAVVSWRARNTLSDDVTIIAIERLGGE
jgi:sigma-B regulation protein RsbU (phosphoserine phosphatase)